MLLILINLASFFDLFSMSSKWEYEAIPKVVLWNMFFDLMKRCCFEVPLDD